MTIEEIGYAFCYRASDLIRRRDGAYQLGCWFRESVETSLADIGKSDWLLAANLNSYIEDNWPEVTI